MSEQDSLSNPPSECTDVGEEDTRPDARPSRSNRNSRASADQLDPSMYPNLTIHLHLLLR